MFHKNYSIMNKTIIGKLFLAIFTCLLITSCSSEDSLSEDINENKQETVFIAKSLTDLNTLFDGIILNSIGEDAENEVFESKMQAKLSIIPMFVTGYDNFLPYQGKENLVFSTSDIATANKLGIKINNQYYLTIYQYNKQIATNGFNPTVAYSPDCGLMLNNELNNYIDCIRGYRGFYYPSTKLFSMNTSLMCFKDRSTAGKIIWYPCTPEGVEWRITAVWK